MNTLNTNGMENGHSFVDLGLPSGLLWATCNVGADSPEQAGLYFAWGEAAGYTAEQVTASERKYLKKTYKAKKIKADLTLEQDAAHANMGGKWRMPTKAEFDELIDNCDVTGTDDYKGTGVAGYLFTSKTNGNSVFFPAVGGCDGSSVYDVNLCGYFWAASWGSESGAFCFHFYSRNITTGFYCDRYCGISVRAVCER